ncbi:unnamed protein product, partial [Allacma fusca]
MKTFSFLPETSKPYKDEKKLVEKLKYQTNIPTPSFPANYASAYFASKCPKKLVSSNKFALVSKVANRIWFGKQNLFCVSQG